MLKAEGICKRYKGKTVLKGAGFTLRPGECLGVAGHNGSGKSTLLSIVAQVTVADGGSLTCDGKSIWGNRAFMQKNVGYVPQQNSLLPDLTVEETLRFWVRAYGLAVDDPFAPGGPAAMLGLQPLAKKRVATLSGGMQKRLSVALALVHAPRFLLLDEVPSALDRHYRFALFSWLDACKQSGASILYCSHEIGELEALCDTILVLREGETVFYGPKEKFPTGAAELDEMLNPAGGPAAAGL